MLRVLAFYLLLVEMSSADRAVVVCCVDRNIVAILRNFDRAIFVTGSVVNVCRCYALIPEIVKSFDETECAVVVLLYQLLDVVARPRCVYIFYAISIIWIKDNAW